MAEVAAGLSDGDLMPLAAYFRAGYTEIEPTIGRYLADMIGGGEGFMPYRLEAICRSKRPRSADGERKMVVGVWVEREVRSSPKGAYAGIIEDACKKFALKKTAVTDAHRFVRSRLEAGVTAPGFDILEHWADIYSADIEMSTD